MNEKQRTLLDESQIIIVVRGYFVIDASYQPMYNLRRKYKLFSIQVGFV